MNDPSEPRCVYDALADRYDAHLERDRWMRRVLWSHFASVFRRGDRILEIGCGTGIDTVHLASRGVHVTAVDISPGMLAKLRTKLASASLESQVEVLAGDAIELMRRLPEPFDGVVSSFAALNSIDLQDFAIALPRLVRSGRRAVFHMLSPRVLGMRSNEPPPDTRIRRVSTVVDGPSRRLNLQAISAPEVYRRFFADAFLLRGKYPLGFLVRRSFENVLPGRLLDGIARVERSLGRIAPFASRGRFFVVDLERRSV